MKKPQTVFMILFLLIIVSFVSKDSQAISRESPTGVDTGGLFTYVTLFEDRSGILIVTSNFVNDSGMEYADITTIAICFDDYSVDGIDYDREFRLRVYDSDLDEFIDIDNELGRGTKERRISVQPHRDAPFLLWTASVASNDGTEIFAEITLKYTYDQENPYERLFDETDTNVMQTTKHEEILKKQKIGDFIGYILFGGLGVLALVFYIRRRY